MNAQVKAVMNGMYGKQVKKEQKEKHPSREYFNALLEACYFNQIIDEACNADMGFNNHFRRTLTLQDCVEAERHANMWARYALEYCV